MARRKSEHSCSTRVSCMNNASFSSPAITATGGFIEEYTCLIQGAPTSAVVTVTRNADGKAQHVVVNHRPRSSVLLFAPDGREVRRHSACQVFRHGRGLKDGRAADTLAAPVAESSCRRWPPAIADRAGHQSVSVDPEARFASGWSSPSMVGTSSETVGWMCTAR